jgi:hypothetical protein
VEQPEEEAAEEVRHSLPMMPMFFLRYTSLEGG